MKYTEEDNEEIRILFGVDIIKIASFWLDQFKKNGKLLE